MIEEKLLLRKKITEELKACGDLLYIISIALAPIFKDKLGCVPYDELKFDSNIYGAKTEPDDTDRVIVTFYEKKTDNVILSVFANKDYYICISEIIGEKHINDRFLSFILEVKKDFQAKAINLLKISTGM